MPVWPSKAIMTMLASDSCRTIPRGMSYKSNSGPVNPRQIGQSKAVLRDKTMSFFLGPSNAVHSTGKPTIGHGKPGNNEKMRRKEVDDLIILPSRPLSLFPLGVAHQLLFHLFLPYFFQSFLCLCGQRSFN